jgi:hypothetical protein
LSHKVQRTRVIESVYAVLQLPVRGLPRAVFIAHSFRALCCFCGLAYTSSCAPTTRTYKNYTCKHERISVVHTPNVVTVSHYYANAESATSISYTPSRQTANNSNVNNCTTSRLDLLYVVAQTFGKQKRFQSFHVAVALAISRVRSALKLFDSAVHPRCRLPNFVSIISRSSSVTAASASTLFSSFKICVNSIFAICASWLIGLCSAQRNYLWWPLGATCRVCVCEYAAHLAFVLPCLNRPDTCHFCLFVVLCFDNVNAGNDVHPHKLRTQYAKLRLNDSTGTAGSRSAIVPREARRVLRSAGSISSKSVNRAGTNLGTSIL